MNENSLLREIGRSFIVSSFVPAALFISIATLLFWDFYPYFLKLRMPSTEMLYAGQWIFVVMFVFWTGFGLYSGWNWTVRLYEGYLFPSFIAKPMIENLYNEKERKMDKRKAFKKEKEELYKLSPEQRDEKLESEAFSGQYSDLQTEALATYQPIELYYPKERDQFLPTRLGNILRASERYSWDRYRMEGVTFFSRLVHLLPPSFAAQLEEQNNKFIFLLNSSFLSFLIGIICVIIALIRLPCAVISGPVINRNQLFQYICTTGSPNNFFQSGFSTLSEGEYLLVGVVFLLSGYLLYRIAIIAANAFARLIRTSFDLYRFDLLKKLAIKLPDTLEEEVITWRKMSQFIISGQDLGEIKLPYVQDKASKEQENAEAQKAVTLNVQPLQVDLHMRKSRRISNQTGD